MFNRTKNTGGEQLPEKLTDKHPEVIRHKALERLDTVELLKGDIQKMFADAKSLTAKVDVKHSHADSIKTIQHSIKYFTEQVKDYPGRLPMNLEQTKSFWHDCYSNFQRLKELLSEKD